MDTSVKTLYPSVLIRWILFCTSPSSRLILDDLASLWELLLSPALSTQLLWIMYLTIATFSWQVMEHLFIVDSNMLMPKIPPLDFLSKINRFSQCHVRPDLHKLLSWSCQCTVAIKNSVWTSGAVVSSILMSLKQIGNHQEELVLFVAREYCHISAVAWKRPLHGAMLSARIKALGGHKPCPVLVHQRARRP